MPVVKQTKQKVIISILAIITLRCKWMCTNAFTPMIKVTQQQHQLNLSKEKNNEIAKDMSITNVHHIQNLVDQLKKATQNVVAVGLLSSAMVYLPFDFDSSRYAEAAEVDIFQPPKTALTIETTFKQSTDDSILKAKIDGKALAKTLIKNRKDLNSSFKRIVDFTSSEIQSGPWVEVGKELLDIEGDVIPNVKVQPPTDWQGALKDLTNGKLDVVVNGEILYIDVNEVKGSNPGDDEITIRIKGTRASLPEIVSDSNSVEQISLGSNIKAFLDKPFTLGEYSATNGLVILLGSTIGISASYVISYQYYLDEIAKQEEEAKEKLLKKKRAATEKKITQEKEMKSTLSKEGNKDETDDVRTNPSEDTEAISIVTVEDNQKPQEIKQRKRDFIKRLFRRES